VLQEVLAETDTSTVSVMQHHENANMTLELNTHQDDVTIDGTPSDKGSVQHPFATFVSHICPVIAKDLEIIQQALLAPNNDDTEGFTVVVSKSNRKENKGYQTRSRGPLSSNPQ